MNDETGDTCNGCKFFMPLFKDENGTIIKGACRRNPPTVLFWPMPVVAVAGGKPKVDWQHQAASFPQVHPGWWCGEHKPARAKLAIEN